MSENVYMARRSTVGRLMKCGVAHIHSQLMSLLAVECRIVECTCTCTTACDGDDCTQLHISIMKFVSFTRPTMHIGLIQFLVSLVFSLSGETNLLQHFLDHKCKDVKVPKTMHSICAATMYGV